MSVEIFHSASALKPADLLTLPMQHRSADWAGCSVQPAFRWCFARDPKTLWFRASLPGGQHFDGQHAAGEFVEGLWEQDVAEFFIKESSGRYQEFNVSPAGAWWTVALRGYRTREETTPELYVSAIEASVEADGWTAILGINHAGLSVQFDDDSLLHVSGIVHRPARQFLSSQPVAGIEPDFHHPEAFQRVCFREFPK